MNNLEGSILFIGTSGSGKTQCLTRIATKTFRKRKKYVLNDKTGLSDKHKKFYPVSWNTDLSKMKNAALVCEDLICLSTKQLATLTNFINVTRRHNNNICLLVTHSLRGNNVYSLIQYMNHFVFTSSRANSSNWKTICQIFQLDNQTAELGADFFANIKAGEFNFLHFDAQTLRATIYDSTYQPVEENVNSSEVSAPDHLTRDEILSRFQSVFKSFPLGDKMYALSHFLVVNLPSDFISPDLSVRYKEKRVSLVDYVQYVTTADLKPPKLIKRLHKHIVKKLVLPELFILNSYFV